MILFKKYDQKTLEDIIEKTDLSENGKIGLHETIKHRSNSLILGRIVTAFAILILAIPLYFTYLCIKGGSHLPESFSFQEASSSTFPLLLLGLFLLTGASTYKNRIHAARATSELLMTLEKTKKGQP